MNISQTIHNLKTQLATALQAATTEPALEEIRITYLGRSGHITQLMAQLKDMSADDKRIFGPELNEFKKYVDQAVDQRKQTIVAALNAQELKKASHFDVTAYRMPASQGSLHVYTQIIAHLEDIFIGMGYALGDGPEVETEYYNFEALNIPADHPARDMQDTFWLTTPGMLLRTHTSSMQIHAMKERPLPLALFTPGRVYRCEATDATHDFMFSQAECVFIDRTVSMANLLATAQAFLQAYFNKNVRIRVRPSYFPFVEPGVEIDTSCPFCTGGCSLCKRTGWIELLGAGLIHPNVLRSCGIDPHQYSGFAFGVGLERLAMIRHSINDIRLFHSEKIGFLQQF